jgi:S-adenosyl-L-methionine hydrolase (adenosine-forming)
MVRRPFWLDGLGRKIDGRTFSVTVITLSTDFGRDDPYVGMIKGVILGINPKASVVDLTHSLSYHHLLQAAFVLHPAYSYFPKGTIHLTVVDPGVGGERRLIAIQGKEYFWVGPDNGLFTLVLRDQPEAGIIHLTNRDFFLKTISSTFHGRDMMAPVAAHLSLGRPLAGMGPSIVDPVLLSIPEPVIRKDRITGQVLWADHFGNLITNISQGILLPLLSHPALQVLVGSHRITKILQHYSQGLPGRLMALIGSNGHLEIACNLGSAAEKMGYQSDKGLKIEVIHKNPKDNGF